MRINKNFFRSLIVIAFVAYAFLLVAFFTGSLETLEALQEQYILVRASLAVLGMLGGASIIGFWFGMLYHWRVSSFRNSRTRWGWLALLVVLNFLGAIVYYVTMIELGKEGTVQT